MLYFTLSVPSTHPTAAVMNVHCPHSCGPVISPQQGVVGVFLCSTSETSGGQTILISFHSLVEKMISSPRYDVIFLGVLPIKVKLLGGD